MCYILYERGGEIIFIGLAMLPDGMEHIFFLKLYSEYKTMIYQVALSVLMIPALRKVPPRYETGALPEEYVEIVNL